MPNLAPTQEAEFYRQDASASHKELTKEEREDVLRPHLPKSPKTKGRQHVRPQPIRDFFRSQFHLLVYTIIHLVFSFYIRIRQTYHVLFDRVLAILYYHHRAPELIKQDVKGLTRVPEHLSVILELKGDDRGQASLEALMDEVAEISAWCTCVGIPMLSIYEKTGIWPVRSHKSYISDKLQEYSSIIYPILIQQFPPDFMHTLVKVYRLYKLVHRA